MLGKVTIGMLLSAGLLFGGQMSGEPHVLKSHGGKKTLFVKAEADTLSDKERAAAQKARLQSAGASHAGEIYYKKGVKNPAYRHITSGRIVVRFTEDSRMDPEAFAEENGLEYVRSIGRDKKSAVYINKGDRDDLSQSNVLLENEAVESAQPDWVLPVKLY